MGKNLSFLLISVFLFLNTDLMSQSIPIYYHRYNFLMSSPGAFQDGMVGFVNPANLRLYGNGEARFYWNTEGTDASSINDWGFFTGVSRLGFGMYRQHAFSGLSITDYRLSLGFGTAKTAWGVSYGWSTGAFDALGRERIISTGTILRPSGYLSIGLLGYWSIESSAKEGVAEVGIRPFGTPRLTLFADAALQLEMNISDAPWSTGVALNLTEGIDLVGRFFEGDAFTFGLSINFGREGLSTQLHYNKDKKHSYSNYMVRTGNRKPSVFPGILMKNRQYLKMNLKGKVKHQKYKLFDKESHRLLDILNDIEQVKKDPTVGAIALNLSSMRVLPEHAWEIREALKDAKKSGISVVSFIDRAGMTNYHLASISDLVILDPEGNLMLPGYLQGLTFFKGTLKKLGLGFDEWRFFKYKSAAEALSRDKMSEADREQRKNYVDDLYETVRSDISEARRMSTQNFDSLVDNEVILLPKQAIKSGLVDTLARWSAVDEIMENFLDRKVKGISSNFLFNNSIKSNEWGAKPKIAIVYALGICDMDRGIRARWLEHRLLALAKDNSVKAIVFRVDSPGGDGMASDLVAEAIKKCKEKKPVIVSQGQVAGSGGYWISMYGDEIIAGPATITGSIGVIGGWLYDEGLSGKIGMTSDFVKRGAHADLGFGIRLPFTGIEVPARNLSQEERNKVEELIRKYYDIFIEKVARGRNLPVDSVRQIGQGHFYSGLDGLSIGLVDKIGGMLTAISIAKYKAGIKPDQEIKFLETPKYLGLFDLGSRISPISQKIESDPVYRYIKMVCERPGQPLPTLLPGTYPMLNDSKY